MDHKLLFKKAIPVKLLILLQSLVYPYYMQYYNCLIP